MKASAIQRLGVQLAAIGLSASLLAACSGGSNPVVYEGDLAEARNCVTDANGPVFTEDFDSGIRNPQENSDQSATFLDYVLQQECVFQLPSGLIYRIHTATAEGASPTPGDLVTVHYRALHPDGVAFNDSYAGGEPVTFPSDRLIAAWVEALPLMRVGENWELYVHPNLGYGPSGTPGGPIGPNQALVFQLELLDLPGLDEASSEADG